MSENTEIRAGTPVKHKSGYLTGRVRKVVNGRAYCTWVRRRQPSYARLENLRVISNLALIVHFQQQERMYDRIRNDPEYADLAPAAVTSTENRLFLLEGVLL